MEKIKISFNDNIPLEANLIKTISSYNNWNREIKIIYVLNGNIVVESDKKTYNLSSNDFILINSYELTNIQNINKHESVFLEFLIDDAYFNKYYKDFSYTHFKCISKETVLTKKKYDEITKFLSKFINLFLEEKEGNNLLILNLINEFVLYLTNNFKVDIKKSTKDISNKNRLIKVLEYLEENYDNYSLKIDDIAEYIELNPQYTLRLFKKSLGIGLMEFLNSLRLRKSLTDLIYSNKSIIEISIDNGFNDNKIYNRIFKKKYKLTPGQYRKKVLSKNNNKTNGNILDTDIKALIEKLIKHSDSNNTLEETKILEMEVNLIELDTVNFKKTKIKPYWKKILCLGNAYEGLKGDVQYQLRKIKSEINFEYIKFNSIFNDEMFIYSEDSEGNSSYNYMFLDKLIDFLLSINLKPFINIGYMPKLLKTKDKFISSKASNVSFPKDLNKWKSLISSMIRHFIERYGEDEVLTWYFEIWNNPDFKGFFWHESNEKFFILFKETFLSIKRISPEIKVGGPSTLPALNWEWSSQFLVYLKNNDIEIDFFSFHSYGIKSIIENDISPGDLHVGRFKFIEDDFLYNSIEIVTSNIKKIIGKDIELIVSEWNSSPYFLDLVHDTCYKNPFILKSVLDNYNSISGLGYWAFTDISEENGLGSEIFHGGIGIFTINNLKKTAYNAFLLLDKLGNYMVSKGDNYFITSKSNSYQILLYNKAFYNKEYEQGNLNIIDRNNRYSAFDEKRTQEFFVSIDNFENGTYLITKFYLDRNNGSTYDAWLEMGAPEKITKEIITYLKSKENMKIAVEKVEINTRLDIKEIIDPHGVVFLEIQKLN